MKEHISEILSRIESTLRDAEANEERIINKMKLLYAYVNNLGRNDAIKRALTGTSLSNLPYKYKEGDSIWFLYNDVLCQSVVKYRGYGDTGIVYWPLNPHVSIKETQVFPTKQALERHYLIGDYAIVNNDVEYVDPAIYKFNVGDYVAARVSNRNLELFTRIVDRQCSDGKITYSLASGHDGIDEGYITLSSEHHYLLNTPPYDADKLEKLRPLDAAPEYKFNIGDYVKYSSDLGSIVYTTILDRWRIKNRINYYTCGYGEECPENNLTFVSKEEYTALDLSLRPSVVQQMKEEDMPIFTIGTKVLVHDTDDDHYAGRCITNYTIYGRIAKYIEDDGGYLVETFNRKGNCYFYNVYPKEALTLNQWTLEYQNEFKVGDMVEVFTPHFDRRSGEVCVTCDGWCDIRYKTVSDAPLYTRRYLASMLRPIPAYKKGDSYWLQEAYGNFVFKADITSDEKIIENEYKYGVTLNGHIHGFKSQKELDRKVLVKAILDISPKYVKGMELYYWWSESTLKHFTVCGVIILEYRYFYYGAYYAVAEDSVFVSAKEAIANIPYKEGQRLWVVEKSNEINSCVFKRGLSEGGILVDFANVSDIHLESTDLHRVFASPNDAANFQTAFYPRHILGRSFNTGRHRLQ